jgi:sugar (pentulose or hexulose) kinase
VLVKSEQRRPYLALDFGAESGRAVLAHLQSGILTTQEVHRFRNEPVEYGVLPGRRAGPENDRLKPDPFCIAQQVLPAFKLLRRGLICPYPDRAFMWEQVVR